MKKIIDNIASKVMGLNKIDEIYIKTKHLEDRIAEIKAFFGKLFTRGDIIIYLINKAGKILYVDGNNIDTLGVKKEDLVEKNIYDDFSYLSDYFNLGKENVTIFRRKFQNHHYEYLCLFIPVNGLIVGLNIDITNVGNYPEVFENAKQPGG